uniref:Transposase n=1 Tax=Heterorhabditis bacteriophora TaxID=37862 RepID=A0A1I7X814_HETBA
MSHIHYALDVKTANFQILLSVAYDNGQGIILIF